MPVCILAKHSTWTVSSYENAGSFFIFFSKKLIASCSLRPALVAWKEIAYSHIMTPLLDKKITAFQNIPSSITNYKCKCNVNDVIKYMTLPFASSICDLNRTILIKEWALMTFLLEGKVTKWSIKLDPTPPHIFRGGAFKMVRKLTHTNPNGNTFNLWDFYFLKNQCLKYHNQHLWHQNRQ